ncbi:MAG: hypothetical protein LUD27_02330 [Clostridia bacterium]|nr:hypothetical protein [Clostridia bacterium]
MSNTVIKVLSIITTLLGIGVTIVSGVVQDKKMEQTIAAKVAEAIAEKKD